MYLSRRASRARLREAENARRNRAEIVKALSHGQVTRRDLFKMGLFTTTGALAFKNGLSPFAPSAYAQDIPTGAPPTPLFGARPFTQKMPRLNLQTPHAVEPRANPFWPGEIDGVAPTSGEEYACMRLSHHTLYNQFRDEGVANADNPFCNEVTLRGPCEGRAFGEWYAHQRWDELFPKQMFKLSLGPVREGAVSFHPLMPAQDPNSVWSFEAGGLGARGTLPPPLIQMRYGEPAMVRVWNNLPVNREDNNGFGRNESSLHNHNAHNGGSSDGAANCYHFPGTFYDYHWGTMLARADMTKNPALANPALAITPGDPRASMPTENGVELVEGDFRELQGTLWFHDHRFFFTAENVYKGAAGMLTYYSGLDRGHETWNDDINLQLPSGWLKPWGNIDFDLNLMIADWATDQQGQYFFDIFNSDGFLGDQMHVNFAYKPYFEVIPRKYRLRIVNACMSRFIKLALVGPDGRAMPVEVIANDGNLLPQRVRARELDYQGTGERFDIVVDFDRFQIGDRVHLVNLAEHKDGRGPEGQLTVRRAVRGVSDDPAVGALMRFDIVGAVQSVDDLTVTHDATRPGFRDDSRVPTNLTERQPIIEPVRRRHIEWKRDDLNLAGDCIPDCGDKEFLPWTVRVNGESSASLNANRISTLIPRPGETEHWTFENGGGGWDHPIHLHFEEGLTIDRGGAEIPETERGVRKDVWRLRESGTVNFQVTFGEFGGAYVNHCHNTVHEDFAMLMRYDVLTDDPGSVHSSVIPTVNPTPDGVVYSTPEILPEADPANVEFFFGNGTGDAGGTVDPIPNGGRGTGDRIRR